MGLSFLVEVTFRGDFKKFGFGSGFPENKFASENSLKINKSQ